MGSLLQVRGIKSDPSLWTALANIKSRETVQKIHIDYIRAGADIITTNTFRTNPIAVNKSMLDIPNDVFVKKSVEIAVELKKDFNVLVAGSNAPAEDCYQKERLVSEEALIKNHKNHIEWLYSSGCDFILNETQSHLDEIDLISRFCHESGIPFVISLLFNEELKILSGEPVIEIIDLIHQYSPLAISFNCISGRNLKLLFSQVIIEGNWGFYLNCGSGEYEDSTIECGITPHDYGKIILPFLELDPLFTGACCGSDPTHIKNIRELLNAEHRN